MEFKTKLIIKMIAGLLTISFSFFIVSLLLNGYITSFVSITPGWHTTIYPPDSKSVRIIFTTIFLLIVILTNIVYKVSVKVFAYIWLKIFPLQSK